MEYSGPICFLLSLIFGALANIYFFGTIVFLIYNGKKIEFLKLRPYQRKYLQQYKNITKSKNGKTGVLYFLYYASLVCMIVFFISGVLLYPIFCM